MDEMYTPFKAGKKYGLFLGIYLSITLFLSFTFGWVDFSDFTNYSNYISSVLSFIGGVTIVVLAILEFRKKNEELLNLGQGISVALFIGIIGGLFYAVVTYLFFSLGGADLGAQIIDGIQDKVGSENDLKELEMVTDFVTSPIVMAFSAILNTIMSSLLYGVIAAAILKRGN